MDKKKSEKQPIQRKLPGHTNDSMLGEDHSKTKAKRRGRARKFVQRPTKTPGVRTYTNDLVNIFLEALPEAARFSDLISFRNYLYDHLPVNATTTRERYTQYLINRFFPDDIYHMDLVAFADAFRGTNSLKDVLFYMTAASEPILAKVANEVVWPATAKGNLSKTQLLNGVDTRLQVAKTAVRDTAQAIARTYSRLGLAEVTTKDLHLRYRDGNLDALVFILHREFPEPGIYPLRDCLEGPMHTWLLWSKDWIKRGLYRLREKGIIAKISEIDSIHQISTRYEPNEAMEVWLNKK
jgi:DNA repair protein RadC